MDKVSHNLARRFLAEQLLHSAEGQLRSLAEIDPLLKSGRVKTAGEVVFRKDLSGDANQWAYATPNPSERLPVGNFNYNPKHAKPLAKTLRSSLAALGHVLSAYNVFAKVKSARVSPDGALGGKGYIQKIPDMRKQFMNTVEALSSLSDTLYDEVNAPHWSVLSRQETPEEKEEVAAILSDVEEIREDPEEWAETQIEEEFEEHTSKKATSLASKWLNEDQNNEF